MKCAIMQPTYFPWAGYFNLISKVDYFVFLDDAQFQRSSWHNRNKLLVNGTASWITIPVLRKFLGQKLCDSWIDDKKTWRDTHYKLIKQNYGKHPYFYVIEPFIEQIQDSSVSILSLLNIRIIKEISKVLNLTPQFVLSSEMQIKGDRTERLIDICHQLNCSTYISPIGAQDYLQEDGFTQLTDIKLEINEFIPRPYSQMRTENFIGYLSILDVLANLGVEETIKYVLGQA